MFFVQTTGDGIGGAEIECYPVIDAESPDQTIHECRGDALAPMFLFRSHKLHNADIARVRWRIIAHTANNFAVNFTYKIRCEKPFRQLPVEQVIAYIGPTADFAGVVIQGWE